jgi:hypothetical protein
MKIELYNNIITIQRFEKKFINKRYISFLNDKRINKFLSTRKKIVNKNDCHKYFDKFDFKKNFFFAIFDNNSKKLIGTITARLKTGNKCILGNMIGDYKYIGSKQSTQSFNIFLCFVFDYFKVGVIIAGTNKFNLSSNFNLIRNGFYIFKKNKKFYYFKLNKKNLNFITKYKIKNDDRIP